MVSELGAKADPRRDRIQVDGRPVRLPAAPVYVLLNKPVGVVTTLEDPAGRPTVKDLLAGLRRRVFPVGRLDYHSSGLLLLTDDGELAARLTHPRHGVPKVYRVKVRGVPDARQLRLLAQGVTLEDGRTAPAEVRVESTRGGKAWLRIRLVEGRNRQIRRMCAAVGLTVEKLSRVQLGPLKLGRLAPGQWRELTPEEVARLRAAARMPAAPPRDPA